MEAQKCYNHIQHFLFIYLFIYILVHAPMCWGECHYGIWLVNLNCRPISFLYSASPVPNNFDRPDLTNLGWLIIIIFFHLYIYIHTFYWPIFIFFLFMYFMISLNVYLLIILIINVFIINVCVVIYCHLNT